MILIHLGVTARQLLYALARAVDVFSCRIRFMCIAVICVPGNIQTTLATIDAVEGHRIHITHAQFHAYGKEGRWDVVGSQSTGRRGQWQIDRYRSTWAKSYSVKRSLFRETCSISLKRAN